MRRILLSSPKGGCGKTCLARNLATASAHDGLTTAICDLDVQETSRKWALRRAARAGLPQVALVDEVDEGRRLGWEDVELLLGDFAPLDVLVIDTPPSIEAQPAGFRTLLRGVDLVVVPCGPTFDDAESIAPFVSLLREEGRPALVIMNRVKSRTNFSAVKAHMIEAGSDLCAVEVGDRTDIHRTGTQGLAMPDFPGQPGADEIRGVWAAVRQRLSLNGIKAKAEGRRRASA